MVWSNGILALKFFLYHSFKCFYHYMTSYGLGVSPLDLNSDQIFTGSVTAKFWEINLIQAGWTQCAICCLGTLTFLFCNKYQEKHQDKYWQQSHFELKLKIKYYHNVIFANWNHVTRYLCYSSHKYLWTCLLDKCYVNLYIS